MLVHYFNHRGVGVSWQEQPMQCHGSNVEDNELELTTRHHVNYSSTPHIPPMNSREEWLDEADHPPVERYGITLILLLVKYITGEGIIVLDKIGHCLLV